MTSMRFLNPSPNDSVEPGSSELIVIEITKFKFFIYYTVIITIRDSNSGVVWSGKAVNIGDRAWVIPSWPTEPGEYTAEAVMSNAFESEITRCGINFSVTKDRGPDETGR
jgi:hypothetical protein